MSVNVNVTKRMQHFNYKGLIYELKDGVTPADVIAGRVVPISLEEKYVPSEEALNNLAKKEKENETNNDTKKDDRGNQVNEEREKKEVKIEGNK